jgi:hypothetical protein
MPVVAGKAVYPEDLAGKMKAQGIDIDAFDALRLAEEAGSSKAVNLVLMGRLSRHFDFPEEEWFGVRNLGAKTIDEAITLVASIKSGGSQYILHNYEYNQEDSDENCNRICVFEKNIDE